MFVYCYSCYFAQYGLGWMRVFEYGLHRQKHWAAPSINQHRSLKGAPFLIICGDLFDVASCLSQGLLSTGLPGIRAWINNHEYGFIWRVITHPCPNFNGRLTNPSLSLGYWWVIASPRKHVLSVRFMVYDFSNLHCWLNFVYFTETKTNFIRLAYKFTFLSLVILAVKTWLSLS